MKIEIDLNEFPKVFNDRIAIIERNWENEKLKKEREDLIKKYEKLKKEEENLIKKNKNLKKRIEQMKIIQLNYDD